MRGLFVDDMLFGLAILLAALIGIGGPVVGLIGMLVALQAKRDLYRIQLRLIQLEADMRTPPGPAPPAADHAPATAPEPAPIEAAEAALSPPEPGPPRPTSVPPIPAAA